MFPKQNILYFILREKEKIQQIHYSTAHRQLVTKFLGVYLDEIISWKHHIDIVTTRNCKSIGILYRTSHTMNKFFRKYLYFFFINCYLNYTNVAWTRVNKSKLQGLYPHQKHAAKIINFKDKFTSAKLILEQFIPMTVYEMSIFQTLLCTIVKMETCRQFLNTFIRYKTN